MQNYTKEAILNKIEEKTLYYKKEYKKKKEEYGEVEFMAWKDSDYQMVLIWENSLKQINDLISSLNDSQFNKKDLIDTYSQLLKTYIEKHDKLKRVYGYDTSFMEYDQEDFEWVREYNNYLNLVQEVLNISEKEAEVIFQGEKAKFKSKFQIV